MCPNNSSPLPPTPYPIVLMWIFTYKSITSSPYVTSRCKILNPNKADFLKWRFFSFLSLTDHHNEKQLVSNTLKCWRCPKARPTFAVTQCPHQNKIIFHSPLLSNFWPKMLLRTKCQADHGCSAKCSQALVILGFLGSENSPLVSHQPPLTHCLSDSGTRSWWGLISPSISSSSPAKTSLVVFS